MRDVSYDEDRCRVHTGHLPRNLACLANLAISIPNPRSHWISLPDTIRSAPNPLLQTMNPSLAKQKIVVGSYQEEGGYVDGKKEGSWVERSTMESTYYLGGKNQQTKAPI